ncbi:cell division protein ZapA [Ruminococcaceae bacterium R-25]|nr:cell division protein ZapA [Ruminococcaceae bacterium R-25]SUQ11231.1 Cell division protein ZapA [Oscillospiraceae bacterium]
MRKSNSSLLGKYSDGSYKRKGKKDQPAIVEYKQLYKGEIKAKTVTEKKYITLDEKIKARTKPANEDDNSKEESAQITIGGVQYLVRSGDAGYDHMMKVGKLADEIYVETKKNNPYIATNKTAIMSLFEACDQLIALRAENNALKTELTYYKVKANEYAKERRPDIKPTPMEELADKVNEGLFEHLKKKDDK